MPGKKLVPCPQLAKKRKPELLRVPPFLLPSVSGEGEGGGGDAGGGWETEIARMRERERQLTVELEEAKAALAVAEGRGTPGLSGVAVVEDGSAWSLDRAMEKRLQAAFESVDANNDGLLDQEEREQRRGVLLGVLNELGVRNKTLDNIQGSLMFTEFKRVIEAEREVTLKAEGLAAAELSRLVAGCIPGGCLERPLEGLEEISKEELDKLCATHVLPKVRTALLEVQKHLKKTQGEVVGSGGGAAKGGNGKFAVEEGATLAKFGHLEDFHKGIADKIGLPHARLMEGLEAEHTRRGDSYLEFSPLNYDTITKPAEEWAVVRDEAKGKEKSVKTRRVRPLEEVMEDSMTKKAKLREEEVIALMLYTGPMFYKYNAVLRGFPQKVVEALSGNMYATTIYCVVSGIIKLSKVMKLPGDRKVYRGLKGLELPEAFTAADEFGVRGGVEFAMLSTTTDRGVALQYAGDVMPTLFEIGVGGVDRGASLTFLSQYPEEDEILFPPRSYLEVTNDVPRLIPGPDGKMVRVVKLKVNANLTSSTIEELEGRRKQLFLSAGKNAVLEIKSKLGELLITEQVEQVLSHRGYDRQHSMHIVVKDSIIEELEKWLEGYRVKLSEWYNQERQYAAALKELTVLEGMAIGKFECWIDGTSGLAAPDLKNESFVQVSRRAQAEVVRKLAEVREGPHSEGDVRRLALRLCQSRGAVIKGVDEPTGVLEEPGVVSCGALGDVTSLQVLCLAGCNVNGTALDQSTGLHRASMMGHLEYVKQILAAGADAYAKNKTGETCLHVACQMGHSEVVDYLVEEYGKELCMEEMGTGATCALLACRNGRMRALRRLGEVGGKDLLMKVANNGASCAVVAASQGRIEILRYLFDICGKDILMLVTDEDMSCAYLAAQNGQLECLRFLEKEGGEELLAKVAKTGMNCAHRASEQGHLEVLRFLAGTCKGMLTTPDKAGVTCAHLASKAGKADCLEFLAGACGRGVLGAQTAEGKTCKDFAHDNKQGDVIRFLGVPEAAAEAPPAGAGAAPQASGGGPPGR